MHIDYMVAILGVRGLKFSVSIMGYINKKMLVIEVNVEFSMMNGFVFKYLHIQQATIIM